MRTLDFQPRVISRLSSADDGFDNNLSNLRETILITRYKKVPVGKKEARAEKNEMGREGGGGGAVAMDGGDTETCRGCIRNGCDGDKWKWLRWLMETDVRTS